MILYIVIVNIVPLFSGDLYIARLLCQTPTCRHSVTFIAVLLELVTRSFSVVFAYHKVRTTSRNVMLSVVNDYLIHDTLS